MQPISICRAIVAITLLMPGCSTDSPVKIDDFHDAIISNDASRVKRMLAKDATLANSRDDRGSTALHLSLHRPDLDIAAALLNAGADPNARDETGGLPIDYHPFNPGALKLLIEHGANRESLDSALLTVQMHLTEAEGVNELVALLRRAGAGRGESPWWGNNRRFTSLTQNASRNEVDAPYRIWQTEAGEQMMITLARADELGSSTPVAVYSFSRDLTLQKRGHVFGGVLLSTDSRIVEISFTSTEQGSVTQSAWYTAIAERGGVIENEPRAGSKLSFEEIRHGQVTIHFIHWDKGPFPTKEELTRGLHKQFQDGGGGNDVLWNHELADWQLRDVDRGGAN